jgi:hypothetical protein
MKQTVYFISLLAILLSACHSQTSKEEQGDAQNKESKTLFKTIEGGEVCYSLGDHYAGEFIIGDEIPNPDYLEHFSIRKETNTRQTEEGEEQETLYILSEGTSDVIYLKPILEDQDGSQKEVIGEMVVLSEKFKTNHGIGVNSTLTQFIKTYPEYSLWYTYVSDLYVLETPIFEGQFLLSSEDYNGEIDNYSDIIELQKEDFNPETRIRQIRIF